MVKQYHLKTEVTWLTLLKYGGGGYDMIAKFRGTLHCQCEIPPFWPIQVLVVPRVVVDMAKTRRGAVEVPSSAVSRCPSSSTSLDPSLHPRALGMNPDVSWCRWLRFSSFDTSKPWHFSMYIDRNTLVYKLFKCHLWEDGCLFLGLRDPQNDYG